MAEADMIEQTDHRMLDQLADIVGRQSVALPGEGRDYLTRDIFFDRAPTAFIVRPANKREVAALVSLAARHGYAVFPRGGGMSYTRGYIPSVARSLLVDLSALSQIVEIDETNLFVTVQAGITWKSLYETLRAKGLRLPAFGTISGANATVGGGLSQGSLFYGSTQYGPTAEHVLGLEVVLPTGELIKTGQGAMSHAKPFWRWHGPDLTGPFLGDCGALGIKVEMTFRMIRWPASMIPLSFGFDDFESVWLTQNEIARAGLAADCFSFDEVFQHQLKERNSLIQDAAALRKVIATSDGVLQGLKRAATIVAGGKGFLDRAPYSLHMVIEGRPAATQESAALAREVALKNGGRELPDSVPRMIRAEPFASMDQTLGPAGERWVPVHGLLALSDGLEGMKRLRELFASYAPRMIEHRVLSAILSNPVGSSAMIIEALFYWPDSPHELHEQIVSPAKLAKGRQFKRNDAAHALVNALRTDILKTFAELGSAPFGIGRTSPYRANRDPASYRLLQTIKQSLDPSNLMNPGVLGL